MKKIRVLLADDHKVLRDGLKLLINNHSEMEVVGEAANGKEVLQQVAQLKPDVIVMDLSMPQLNGLQTTEKLKAEYTNIRVVALTVHEDESYFRQLCRAGAAGYVLKRSAGEELIQAIQTVVGGGFYFDSNLASKTLAAQFSDPGSNRDENHAPDLSPREKEVLAQLAWGFSNKEIADKLTLSVKTVETYKVRIFEKLKLRSRTEIVQYALRQGWLREDAPPGPK